MSFCLLFQIQFLDSLQRQLHVNHIAKVNSRDSKGPGYCCQGHILQEFVHQTNVSKPHPTPLPVSNNLLLLYSFRINSLLSRVITVAGNRMLHLMSSLQFVSSDLVRYIEFGEVAMYNYPKLLTTSPSSLLKAEGRVMNPAVPHKWRVTCSISLQPTTWYYPLRTEQKNCKTMSCTLSFCKMPPIDETESHQNYPVSVPCPYLNIEMDPYNLELL